MERVYCTLWGIKMLTSKHPWDWFQHFTILLILSVVLQVMFNFHTAWTVSLTASVTWELAQIDAGVRQRWDHLVDLLFDTAGFMAGFLLYTVVF